MNWKDRFMLIVLGFAICLIVVGDVWKLALSYLDYNNEKIAIVSKGENDALDHVN